MKQLFSLAFLILALNFNAQIKHEFGPENEPTKDLRFNEVLGGTENYFYVHKIKFDGRDPQNFIQKMDRKTLLPVDEKEMVLVEKDFTMEVNRLVCYDDELTAFVTKRYKRTRDFILVAVTYDLNTLTKIKETHLNFFAVKPWNQVKLSPDNSKAIIKLYGDTTEFIVYDLAKGAVSWNGKRQEKFKNNAPLYTHSGIDLISSSSSTDFALDNEGNIHFAYSVWNKSSSTDNFSVFDFYYSFINTKTTECRDHQIKTDYLFKVWDPMITCLPDKKVIVSSMFKEINPDKKKEVKYGMANCVIDNNRSMVLSKKFIEISQFNPNNDVNNNPKHYKRAYYIDEAFTYGSSSILIGHKGVRTETGIENNYMITGYYDIFVLKINQNSDIDFYKELPYSSRINGWQPNYVFRQFIAEIKDNTLFVFHNEATGTTKIIESNDKESELFELWTGGKQLICNKMNLMDGINKRTIIELPEGCKFNPVPESKYLFSRPFGSSIYNRFNNTVYIPLLWGYKMERYLKATLD